MNDETPNTSVRDPDPKENRMRFAISIPQSGATTIAGVIGFQTSIVPS